MLISTKGRYALYVLVDLAEHADEEYVPLKEIAERQNISKKYLENILKVLVEHGLLAGIKGRGGGYRLTMPPEDYRLGDILRLTEGGLNPVSCAADAGGECTRMAACPSRPVWQKLDSLINSYLDSVTLADLLNAPAGAAPDTVCTQAQQPL